MVNKPRKQPANEQPLVPPTQPRASNVDTMKLKDLKLLVRSTIPDKKKLPKY